MQWIGVDGGGTKTLFELYDSDMNVLQQLRLPSVCMAVGWVRRHARGAFRRSGGIACRGER